MGVCRANTLVSFTVYVFTKAEALHSNMCHEHRKVEATIIIIILKGYGFGRVFNSNLPTSLSVYKARPSNLFLDPCRLGFRAINPFSKRT